MADYATGNAYRTQHDYLEKIFTFSFLSYIVSLLYLTYFIFLAKKNNQDRYIRRWGTNAIPLTILNNRLSQDAKNKPPSSLK